MVPIELYPDMARLSAKECERRFGGGAWARPDQEEHRLPGPALGGMVLQEAGALSGRQSGLRGAQDKSVRLTAKDDGGVGGVGSAWGGGGF
jgi:hypothetical protein